VYEQKLKQTQAYYEQFPFIEGGPQRITWWQNYLRPFLADDLVRGRLIGDIGSSVGEISRGFANRGASMVCLDITLAALHRCREINPEAEIFHGNALELPFADGTFDHTICIGVLMVTPDCRKGIQEVARVTTPGGTIVLFIYNYWSYLNLLYHLCKPITRTVPLRSVPRGVVRLMQPFVKSHLQERLDEHQLRRLLGDKLWTPNATFHTLNQIRKWGEEEGLTMATWKRFYHAYANVMIFKKSGTLRAAPPHGVKLRCLKCGHSPLPNSQEAFSCEQCGATYDKVDGIYRCLP
jgi:ubiquinone/menaquinone biosynthesis C-methylase UbiE